MTSKIDSKIEEVNKAEVPLRVHDMNNEAIDPIEMMINASKRGRNVLPDEVYNERLGITYFLEPIDDSTFENIMEQSTRLFNFNGSLQTRIDTSKLNRLLLVECCKIGMGKSVFKDSRLTDTFGTPEKSVAGVLLPGEIVDYAQKIMRKSGFAQEILDQGFAVKVKNS